MPRETQPDPVRRSPFSGSWYPAQRAQLERDLRRYLGEARGGVAGRVLGLISPHAGLHYSGPVAAWGYALLEGLADLTAVLVGPSHRGVFEGVAVYERGSFETPLGRVAVDEELAAALIAASPEVRGWNAPHLAEHSLEMQLPFLQHLVPGLRIVPALMGTQTRGEVDALAEALAGVLPGAEREWLLVASSDLSHYLPASEAGPLDGKVLGDIERYDCDGLMGRLERHRGHACGGGPIVAVMKAARALGANQSRVLRYADSGDVAGDKSQVVGYVSAALCRA
jgi:MEMO1 family protein